MSLEGICSREVDTAEPEETVLKVAQRMHARKVGTLVVVNADQEPVGMITDRDLTTRVVAVGKDPALVTVQDVMTLHPAMVTINADIKDALRSMRTNRCRRIPVVDRTGKLTGIVSLDDILVIVAKEFQLISAVITEESPQSLARTS